MDRCLGQREGLDVPWFAKKFKVSTKTVKRDLKAFEDIIGREMGYFFVEHKGRDYKMWRYPQGTRCIFASNMGH